MKIFMSSVELVTKHFPLSSATTILAFKQWQMLRCVYDNEEYLFLAKLNFNLCIAWSKRYGLDPGYKHRWVLFHGEAECCKHQWNHAEYAWRRKYAGNSMTDAHWTLFTLYAQVTSLKLSLERAKLNSGMILIPSCGYRVLIFARRGIIVEKLLEYMAFRAHWDSATRKEDPPVQEFMERLPPEIVLEL